MENLLPCPFCGGKAELENWKLACEEIGTIISCAVCDACVSEGIEDGNGWRERAVKKWNRRAQQEQPDVVHGRWVHIKEDGMTVAGKCSNCGYTIFNDSDETNYCPSCGAQMAGGEKDAAD